MLGLRDWSSFLLYIMERQYIIAIIWLSGFLLSHWMLKVEHESENDDYTNGDKAWAVLLSLLSLVMVLIMLAKAWVKAKLNEYTQSSSEINEPIYRTNQPDNITGHLQGRTRVLVFQC